MKKKTMPYNHINIKFHHGHVFLILSIKLLNVNLEKILKSEQFLTEKGNLLNSFAAWYGITGMCIIILLAF